MKDVQSNARINGSRLWDSLMEMATKGPGVRGGNNRQTLTDADKEGRDLFKRWCEEAGMDADQLLVRLACGHRHITDRQRLNPFINQGFHFAVNPPSTIRICPVT